MQSVHSLVNVGEWRDSPTFWRTYLQVIFARAKNISFRLSSR